MPATATVDPTVLVEMPDGSAPFGTGPVFEVIVRSPIESLHGNLVVSPGRYQAQQEGCSDAQEGSIVLWSPDHYAGGRMGGLFVSLPAWDWTFPGEPSRPLPEHDCFDHLRSGVAGGVFCGICQEEVF